MAVERVAEMTVQQLQVMIEQAVDRRLRDWFRPADPRSLQEIFDSIDRNMWTPPPGAKSTLELLREDRT